MHHDDGTPVRRRPSGVAEEDEYCCDRHLSVSCPCIDQFDEQARPQPTSGGGGCGGVNGCGVDGCGGGLRTDTLRAPSTKVSGFPRVNSAPVTPMAADCVDMTDMSALSGGGVDDVTEPLIRAADRDASEGITFVWQRRAVEQADERARRGTTLGTSSELWGC